MLGIGALTGALLLGSAPSAAAEDMRGRQWALDFFAAEDIWEHATGNGVTVAVVDDGFDTSQPDLKGAFAPGKKFETGKGADAGRHGTAMAALIAARGSGPGRASGMKGLAPGAKIMPLTVGIGKAGNSAAKAIRYAADHGADVVNLSYAGPPNQGEREAVAHAVAKDVVVVAGAGNSNVKVKQYPAGYPGVVSVGGLGRDGTMWSGSAWGNNLLVAPAENNVTPDKTSGSGYSYTDGTSDSSAYVSATAALVREKHPDLTAGQVINRLVKSTKPLTDAKGNHPKLPDEKFGYGVVRPFRAVTYDYPAGPKEGPLAQPGKTGDSSAGDTASASGASGDNSDSSGWMYVLGPPIVLFGLIALVLVGLAVVIVVMVKRKDRYNRVSDPWAAGAAQPGVPPQQFPGQPFPGQQQPPTPSGQFGQAPPPPPNQPPSQ